MAEVRVIKLIPCGPVAFPIPGYYYQWPDGQVALCIACNTAYAHFAGELGTTPFCKALTELPQLVELRMEAASE